jgi:hypothetical protein
MVFIGGCSGKRTHATKDDALRQLREVMRRKPGRSRGAQPYRCDHCGLWHIGHPPDWAKKRTAVERRRMG